MCTQRALFGPSGSIPSPELLRANNVARRLGLSCRMVRYLAQTGQLRAFKVGMKIWWFVANDVESYKRLRDARYV
jgi:hypothetical protein